MHISTAYFCWGSARADDKPLTPLSFHCWPEGFENSGSASKQHQATAVQEKHQSADPA